MAAVCAVRASTVLRDAPILPLAGATLALVAQNLSNGYYLIFCAPFVAAYCVYEMVDRRSSTSRVCWLAWPPQGL